MNDQPSRRSHNVSDEKYAHKEVATGWWLVASNRLGEAVVSARRSDPDHGGRKAAVPLSMKI